MLRKDFIFCKTRNLLSEFLIPILSQTDKPRQKFLKQTVAAILFSGTLIVSIFARWIHDDCSDIFYRLKRLLNHLVSPAGSLTEAISAYRRMTARFIEPDTPIIIDITDLAKPRAKRMKYLALVRDGSEQKLVPGYWCVEVYAHLKNKRILPLALDVFSIEDPAIGSQNLQIYRTVEAVKSAMNGKGIWVADRGFDALNLYEMWFSLKCQFAVRQRGDRYVIMDNGVHILVRDLAEVLHQRSFENPQSGAANIVFAKVRLPNHCPTLYLVACWHKGIEEPLMILTTLVVENIQQATNVLWYYKRRWACEEGTRFLKSRVGFERFCIRRYEAIQRPVVLAMLAMGFLTWVLLRSRQLSQGLYKWTSKFRKNSKFIYYRLLDGLQGFVMAERLKFSEKLLKPPLKNG